MAQIIKLKNSSTPSSVPTTGDLILGEVAVNTNDGKLFLKKDDGLETVVEISGNAESSREIAREEIQSRTNLTFRTDGFGTATENMVAGRIDGVVSVTYTTGDIVSTGDTTWRKNAGTAGDITDFDNLGNLNIVTLSQAINSDIAYEGQLIRISDRANQLYEYQTGQVENLIDIYDSVAIAGLSLVLVVESAIIPIEAVTGDVADTVDVSSYINRLSQVLGIEGGYIDITGKRLLIDNNVTLGKSVGIIGGFEVKGNNGTQNLDNDYLSMGSHLILNPAASLFLEGTASVGGVLISRKGMSIPEDPTLFSGTGIVVAGEDVSFTNSLVLGLARAFDSQGYQRPVCDFVYGDCTNGIRILNCGDIARVTNCHFWPFVTVSDPVTYTLDRMGTAYEFGDFNDWLKSVGNFSYGYLRGHVIRDANSIELTNCSHDGTQLLAGSIGIEITGDCQDIILNQPQCAAQRVGLRTNLNAGYNIVINSPSFWFNGDNGMVFDGSENVFINGSGFIRDSAAALTINTTATVYVDDIVIRDVVTPFRNLGTGKLVVGEDVVLQGYGNNPSPLFTGNEVYDSVAVADPLLFPVSAGFVSVSGAGGFGSARMGYPREEITIYASTGTLNIFSGGGFINRGGATVNLAVGEMITYQYIEGKWRQV